MAHFVITFAAPQRIHDWVLVLRVAGGAENLSRVIVRVVAVTVAAALLVVTVHVSFPCQPVFHAAKKTHA